MTVPSAFGGAPRQGEKLLRFAYLDEAGTSAKEPFAVVAGVMVHGDREQRSLERALSDLADRCALPHHRNGFLFHATELFHGGKTMSRGSGYSDEYRRSFLKVLAHIPADNGFPVSVGYVRKSDLIVTGHKSVQEVDTFYHTVAFIEALVGIERYMREHLPDEVCQLVAEDHPSSKGSIRRAANLLKDPRAVAALPGDLPSHLPLRHITNTVFFAEKAESSPLQVADTCAFLIKRHLERRDGSEEYYDALAPALIFPLYLGPEE